MTRIFRGFRHFDAIFRKLEVFTIKAAEIGAIAVNEYFVMVSPQNWKGLFRCGFCTGISPCKLDWWHLSLLAPMLRCRMAAIDRRLLFGCFACIGNVDIISRYTGSPYEKYCAQQDLLQARREAANN
ncbi:hypothetical protein X760_17025 [Mesorhizobium sp. LSHC422A00]|nr:hypothetical protein X760_17025 [Mesorhizobium sp. LSHC422A00]